MAASKAVALVVRLDSMDVMLVVLRAVLLVSVSVVSTGERMAVLSVGLLVDVLVGLLVGALVGLLVVQWDPLPVLIRTMDIAKSTTTRIPTTRTSLVWFDA